MKLSLLSEIFEIEYGNQLDYNKMIAYENGVNYVTRSSKNLGIKEKVSVIEDIKPYEKGCITVTLGGSYLLSAFVQPSDFYTAQNIKVLKPKSDMSFETKAFYCLCIKNNRFRYSSHGREANKSLDSMMVPALSDLPAWVNSTKGAEFFLSEDYSYDIDKPYIKYSNEIVKLDDIFDVKNGVSSSTVVKSNIIKDECYVPFIRPSKTQTTSYVEYADKNSVDERQVYPRHTLYVSTNGQGSHTYTYVSTSEFIPNSDIPALVPKRNMSLQEKLYYAQAISLNRKLFSYGRKPKGKRLKALKLPLYPPPFIYGESLFEAAIEHTA